MKKTIDAKTLVYLALGFVSLGPSMFLGKHAFEDQAYICGMLNGFAIVLLLHAVYFAVKDTAAALKSNDAAQ